MSHLQESRTQKETGCPNTDFIPGRIWAVWPLPDTFPFPPGPLQLSSPFFGFPPFYFYVCLLSICFYPHIFFYHLPICSPASSSPFTLFPAISYRFLVCLARTTQVRLLPPLFTLVEYQDTNSPPPVNISVTSFFIVLVLQSPSTFSLSFSPNYYVPFYLPALTW